MNRNVYIVKTRKPFGLFGKKAMTERFEVIDSEGEEVASFSGEPLSDAEHAAKIFVEMIKSGATYAELGNFCADYSDAK